MITYDTLLQEALKMPVFKEKYEDAYKQDDIDSESGNHTVFHYVFVPILVNAIKKNETENKNILLSFLEEMASSKDRLVTEVCDYTVLEELYDEIPGRILYPLLGQHTKEGYLTVAQFMKPNY